MTEAWVSIPSNSMLTRRAAALDAVRMSSRRGLFWNTAALVVIYPSVSLAVDPLDAFGKSLSTPTAQQGWPHTPSPLPSSIKSASELTSTPPTRGAGSTADMPTSDFLKALEKSSKKKQVDPLTHG